MTASTLHKRIYKYRGFSDRIFSLRCPSAVRHAVVRALENRSRSVRFYEVVERNLTFKLFKRPLDTDEMLAVLPKRHRDIYDAFHDLDVFPPPDPDTPEEHSASPDRLPS